MSAALVTAYAFSMPLGIDSVDVGSSEARLKCCVKDHSGRRSPILTFPSSSLLATADVVTELERGTRDQQAIEVICFPRPSVFIIAMRVFVIFGAGKPGGASTHGGSTQAC